MAASTFQHLMTHRELTRNHFRDPGATRVRRRDVTGHCPVNAQDQALARRRRLARLARHEGLLAHVISRLAASSRGALAGKLNATPWGCLGSRTPIKALDGRPDPAAGKAAAQPAVSRKGWKVQ